MTYLLVRGGERRESAKEPKNLDLFQKWSWGPTRRGEGHMCGHFGKEKGLDCFSERKEGSSLWRSNLANNPAVLCPKRA